VPIRSGGLRLAPTSAFSKSQRWRPGIRSDRRRVRSPLAALNDKARAGVARLISDPATLGTPTENRQGWLPSPRPGSILIPVSAPDCQSEPAVAAPTSLGPSKSSTTLID